MTLHVARLIVTILLFVLALAGLAAGHWFQALFWALIMIAVGYPFVRHGRVDLHYERDPVKVVIYSQPGASPQGAPQGAALATLVS